jgi:hypothetical protein
MALLSFLATKRLSISSSSHAMQGGGFMGELSKDDPDVARAQRSGAKEILPDGNELVKSDQHYCILVDEDGYLASVSLT